MTDDELKADLIDRSKRTGLSVPQLCYIARITAQSPNDPLPPENWGDPFEDWDRERTGSCDFTTMLKRVPPPDAQIDLSRAWREFADDARNINVAVEQDLDVNQRMAIALKGERWIEFWMVRDPCPERRNKLAERLRELQTLRIQTQQMIDAKPARRAAWSGVWGTA